MIKVLVHFSGDVPDDIQSKCLWDFELNLRERSGLDIRVLKERMGDDSALRIVMDKRRTK